jgi:large subunit ribosomal protein L28
MRQYPNLQRKRIWVPELNRFIKVRASTRALRSIDKDGVMTFLKKNDLRIEDIT